MKISRKMKKFFVSILTVTLSIIMFATQTSALNVETKSAEFTDNRQIIQATEWITWDKNRNCLLVGVDLSIDENDYYSTVWKIIKVPCLFFYVKTPETNPFFHLFLSKKDFVAF